MSGTWAGGLLLGAGLPGGLAASLFVVLQRPVMGATEDMAPSLAGLGPIAVALAMAAVAILVWNGCWFVWAVVRRARAMR